MNRRVWWLGGLVLAVACGDDATMVDTDSNGASGDSGATAATADDATADGPMLDESAGACVEAFELECPADQSVQCVGPQTPVMVEAPEAPCEEWTVSGEAPESLPPGDHEVEFVMELDEMVATCTTAITVIDEDPPFIDCPEPGTLVLRTEPGQEVMPPSLSADDLCWDELEFTTDPPVLPGGVVDVEYTATDGSGNSASCTTQIEVLDAFAVEGFRIISATLTQSGGTDVTLAWEPNPASPISGYRVEIADGPDGPWTVLDTVPGDEQLYTHSMTDPTAWFRVVTESELGEGGATAGRIAYSVTDEFYDIRDVPVPGVPFDTTLYGVVRYPSALDEGPFPLIVVLHGNHGNCRDPGDPNSDFCSTSQDHECSIGGADTAPNAEGYIYFLDTLAAQGYVTVSISGNAMNCRTDYIIERSQLIVEHLRHWSDWGAGQGALGGVFSGGLDLSQVGLVGHSRGGDAVSNVPGILANSPVPGVDIQSVFAIAPTDFHDVQVRNTDLAVLLPACDGDVSNLSGHRHYDRSINFDDGVEQAQVMFIGANHNYFNTEWRLSEWELFPGTHPNCEPSSAPQQREQTHMLEATLGSWFGTTLQGEATEAFVMAEEPSPSAFDAWAQASLDLRWSYSSPDRVSIDDFTGPETPNTNDLGGTNTLGNDWFLWEVCQATNCDTRYPHLRNSLRLLWEEGNTPLARFELGGYDASGAGTLSFRVVSRFSSLNTGLAEQDFFIRVIDTEGGSVQLPVSDLKVLNHLYPQTDVLEILETVRLPIDTLLEYEPALAVDSLEALEFEMTALDRSGSVIITDLEFAQ
ncbi:MAG: hypothetical protein AAF799_37810 [Myxococcota bacterium]